MPSVIYPSHYIISFYFTANRCSKPCGANSHCTTNNVCKCDQGYKLMNDQCIYRNTVVTSQCSETNPCLNGGTCSNGSCVCRENYKGEHCETSKLPFSYKSPLNLFNKDINYKMSLQFATIQLLCDDLFHNVIYGLVVNSL